MSQKCVTYIIYGSDERCDDIRRFIEDAGIRLDVRDMKDRPLSADELDLLFGHNPLTYFVNPASIEFSKLGLEVKLPARADLLELMSKHPGLLRRPIIKTIRLVTAGYNKEKIAEMLQISRNGERADDVNGNRPGRITRRALPSRK